MSDTNTFSIHFGKDEDGWFADFGEGESGTFVTADNPEDFLAQVYVEIESRVRTRK